MKSLYKFIFGLSAVSLLALGGCKKFRDINKNPNNPEQVTIELILPSAQGEIAQQLGGKLQIIGGIWGQYWTQNPSASQYRIFEQYQISGSDISNAWDGLYAGALMDLEQVIKNSGTKKNYGAIAKILKGYTYQLLSDQFGDIPFSEALKGESGGILSPHYDSQEAVYTGIIALVKEGMAEIDDAGATPAGDDLIYHGDMAAWAKFGNTLLLKVYMRLALKSPAVAQAGIADLYANGIGFLESTAKITYSSEAGNYNPLYSEMNNAVINKIQNLVASSTAIDSFNANEDPRIEAFYTPGTAGFAGLAQGDYGSSISGTAVAHPSATVGGDALDITSAVAPVIFMSDYESLLLQAEAEARGWGDGSVPAADLFTAAIEANFAAFGVDGTDYLANSAWAVYPTAGTMDEQIEWIITQKWFCMCGNQNIESWTEWRRTGYPTFFAHSPNSRIDSNFPVRMPYPDGEVSNNLNFPGQKQVTDKVWWDVN